MKQIHLYGTAEKISYQMLPLNKRSSRAIVVQTESGHGGQLNIFDYSPRNGHTGGDGKGNGCVSKISIYNNIGTEQHSHMNPRTPNHGSIDGHGGVALGVKYEI